MARRRQGGACAADCFSWSVRRAGQESSQRRPSEGLGIRCLTSGQQKGFNFVAWAAPETPHRMSHRDCETLCCRAIGGRDAVAQEKHNNRILSLIREDVVGCCTASGVRGSAAATFVRQGRGCAIQTRNVGSLFMGPKSVNDAWRIGKSISVRGHNLIALCAGRSPGPSSKRGPARAAHRLDGSHRTSEGRTVDAPCGSPPDRRTCPAVATLRAARVAVARTADRHSPSREQIR